MPVETPSWEYRLEAWPATAREALGVLVRDAAIPNEWRASTLIVPTERRPDVDALVASLADERGNGNGLPPAGWYADPWSPSPWRWWDGTTWTGYVSVPPKATRPWFPPKGDTTPGLRAGGIAVAGYIGAPVLSLLFVLVLSALDVSVHSMEALVAGQAVLWSVLFGACVVAVRRHGNGSLRELGLQRLKLRDFGSGTVAALIGRFGAGAIALVFFVIFRGETIRRSSTVLRSVDSTPLEIAVLVLILVVGAPFFEELFFRGLVQGSLTARFGSRRAIWMQALVFALIHYQVGMNLPQFLITFTSIAAVGLALPALGTGHGRARAVQRRRRGRDLRDLISRNTRPPAISLAARPGTPGAARSWTPRARSARRTPDGSSPTCRRRRARGRAPRA